MVDMSNLWNMQGMMFLMVLTGMIFIRGGNPAPARRNSGWRFGYIFVPKRSGRFWMLRGYVADL